MRKFNKDSWHVDMHWPSNTTNWYSPYGSSPYEPERTVIKKESVTLYPHRCTGCGRKYKTMKQSQAHCSYACFALGNKWDGQQPTENPVQVEVSILAPPVKKEWSIDKRRKRLSDIKDIQEILTGDD